MKNLFIRTFVVTLGIIAAGAAAAWSGPPAGTAPNNNAPAPINTTATTQTKAGILSSGNSFVAPNMTANQFCIGTSCVTSWAQAGGSATWASITGKPGNLMYWDTWYGSTYHGSDGNIYLGWLGDWLSNRLNQAVTTGSSPTFGDPYVNNWVRINGGGGIYWQAFGGGWNMSDGTWIRSYGGKPMFEAAGFDTGAASAVNCGGGLGGGYTFRVCGNMQAQRYYDDDPTYYIDSNVDSQMNAVYANAFYYRSDARLKENIAPIKDALAAIIALNPVTFDWKDKKSGAGVQIGFIAQEVEKVVPELVTENTSTTIKAVDYARMAPLLTGAIQEQEKKIEALTQEVQALKAEVDALRAGR